MARIARTRDSLTVDTIYMERKSGLYFVTPDGVGCFWYDTLEEAREEHGNTGPLITIDELED